MAFQFQLKQRSKQIQTIVHLIYLENCTPPYGRVTSGRVHSLTVELLTTVGLKKFHLVINSKIDILAVSQGTALFKYTRKISINGL